MQNVAVSLKDEGINEFWNWFKAEHAHVAETYNTRATIDKIDRKLKLIGSLAWEIGPGIDADHQLTISPGGNPELLPFTKYIVSKAPQVSGWELHYAKPPKQWTLKFNYELTSGEVFEVDANNWQYVLLQYEDGMFELLVYAQNLERLSINDRIAVAEIVIDGMLGEEERLSNVWAIDVPEQMEDRYRDKVSDIKNIKSHFDQLLKR